MAVPEGGTTNLPVALSSQPAANVTLAIAGHAGTDLRPTPPVLTFTTTSWSTPQTVVLIAEEDDDVVNDQVALVLTASGGGFYGNNAFGSRDHHRQ